LRVQVNKMRHSATVDPLLVRPGVHSHNRRRLLEADQELRPPAVRFARLLLLLAGLCGTGYYLYSLADEYVYQRYENWAFDQQIAGASHVSFLDYVKFQAGIAAPPIERTSAKKPEPPSQPFRPVTGATIARLSIERLRLSAIVREGVDAKTLKTAVGHVPATALPGHRGNFAIAAHRDTLFRALKDIRLGDIVSIETPTGTYKYQVAATKIVKPSDVSVLRSDGGGLIATGNNSHLLTMITCYPFYYVGSAPKRFVVEARLLSE
jgi:sortase A